MKILYIGRYNKSEELSGPEKVAKRIIAESIVENQTVFLEYFFDGSIYGIVKKLLGYEVESDNGLKIYRIGLLRIIPFFLKFKPEIIHVITFERFSVIAYLYKMFSKVKIVCSVHGVAVYENENFKNVSLSLKGKDSFSEKIFMKRSDKLLFLSEYELSIAQKYYSINKKKIEFINNGIDEEFHNVKKPDNKNEIPSLVFIGDSKRKDKDFNFLYSNLDKINSRCNLYVIGNFNDAVYKKEIGEVTIISVKKMSKNSLISFLSDKDIFISSSFYDTFSIAAAECMALGLVPIITDHTGISKLITNEKNGFVIKYGAGTDLAEKVNLLLENESLRKEMSQNAKQIGKDLNWDNIYSKYQKIYKTL